MSEGLGKGPAFGREEKDAQFVQVSRVHCNGGRPVAAREGEESDGLLALSGERKFPSPKELQDVVGIEMSGVSVPPATVLLNKAEPFTFSVIVYFETR